MNRFDRFLKVFLIACLVVFTLSTPVYAGGFWATYSAVQQTLCYAAAGPVGVSCALAVLVVVMCVL